jgi:hypothetical protein
MEFAQVLAMQRESSVHVILEAKGSISPFLPGKVAHAVWGNNKMLLLGPYYSETKRLLGDDYSYWSENDDFTKIKSNILSLFSEWSVENNLTLNRPDLDNYFSSDYLKGVINDLNV